MKFSILKGALAAPFFLTVLSSVPAFAERDAKTYPGSACVAQGIQGNPALSINTLGQAFNVNTTTPLSVICPIVQDNVNPTPAFNDGAGIELVNVHFSNKNQSTQPLRCTLNSRNQSGFIGSAQMNLVTGQIASFVPSGGFASDNPYYFLSCTIPAAIQVTPEQKVFSGILSYSVVERIAGRVGEPPALDTEK